MSIPTQNSHYNKVIYDNDRDHIMNINEDVEHSQLIDNLVDEVKEDYNGANELLGSTGFMSF